MLAQLLFILGGILEPFLILSGYISGSKSFPRPLDREEEEYYLKLYQQGDENARNVLIERNLRLVAHIVKKYHNTGKDIEDLISIGTIGLIKGISTFDINKGTRLATYAARCIENEILMIIRSNKKSKGDMSLQEPIGIDKEGNELPLTVYQWLRATIAKCSYTRLSYFWKFRIKNKGELIQSLLSIFFIYAIIQYGFK
ncbi:MAG TPA: sigma-70 family RNA polymerase sigma factor [Tepidimicrobium sp.]|nr:sigma-70 family RNA polymerase sigma factor [Tepidimicrobium sp.]